MKKASIYLDSHYEIGEIDPRLYSSFIEHTCRAVYTGIYEPTHPLADEKGFRKDVLEAVRPLNLPAVRYPGGNFVSAFRWRDSIGPVSQRPRRIWEGAIETNEIGMHEFADWCEKAGTKMMYTVNLGLGDPRSAGDCVEYANFPCGTALSDERIRNGRKEPFGIKTWYLGNELDGDWQHGEKSPVEYGRAANEAAKIMRHADKTIELSAVGSSGLMQPRFGTWEWESLSICYDQVDYLSLHQYYGHFSHKAEDVPNFLASNLHFEEFINAAVAVCDGVRGKLHRKKRLNLSMDEWGPWYHCFRRENSLPYKKEHSRLNTWNCGAEEAYNFLDALVVGTLLNTLIRKADRVKIACLAQLVNVLAPIYTVPGGGMILFPTYYPFHFASTQARGTSLNAIVTAPVYASSEHDAVPVLDCSAVRREDGSVVLMMVNRDLEEPVQAQIDARSFGALRAEKMVQMYEDDLYATNSLTAPRQVAPREMTAPEVTGGRLELVLPKHSWSALILAPAQ